MKILVTGTAGFIGYHLARRLLERGDSVVGLDNINDYYDIDLKYARLNELGIYEKNIQWNKKIISSKYNKHSFYKVDLADKETVDYIFKTENFDAVMNLAAQAGVRYSLENPYVYMQSNIIGFLNILEGCRVYNVKNLSYASSSSVYGLNASQPFKTTDKTEHQVSLYAATKKSNEMMAHTYSHLYGIQSTGLRFFTVYGPWGRPDMAPMLFTDAILNNKPIKVFNHGQMSRDFTYIDDVVDGIIRVIDNPAKPNNDWDAKNPEISSSSAPYKLYNIGNNKPVSLMDFVSQIEEVLEKKAEKIFMPLQKGDVVSTYADIHELMEKVGYAPKTSLKIGIQRFIEWYRQYYK